MEIEIDSETIDECYVESITFLEKIALKSKIHDFKNEISILRKDELDNIIQEYKKLKNDLQDKFVILRSKGGSQTDLNNLMSENDNIYQEEKILIENIEKKFNINIDIALYAAVILT